MANDWKKSRLIISYIRQLSTTMCDDTNVFEKPTNKKQTYYKIHSSKPNPR